MKNKRTVEEIKAEWQALKALRPDVPHYDRYKVNQWAMIDAQIQVLRHGLTLAEINRQWAGTDDERGYAQDARFWMDGGDVLAPATAWKSLAGRKISA